MQQQRATSSRWKEEEEDEEEEEEEGSVPSLDGDPSINQAKYYWRLFSGSREGQ